jgi:hypothetical protein
MPIAAFPPAPSSLKASNSTTKLRHVSHDENFCLSSPRDEHSEEAKDPYLAHSFPGCVPVEGFRDCVAASYFFRTSSINQSRMRRKSLAQGV